MTLHHSGPYIRKHDYNLNTHLLKEANDVTLRQKLVKSKALFARVRLHLLPFTD